MNMEEEILIKEMLKCESEGYTNMWNITKTDKEMENSKEKVLQIQL